MSIISAVTPLYYIPLAAFALDNAVNYYDYDYSTYSSEQDRSEAEFQTAVSMNVIAPQAMDIRDHAHGN